MSCYIHKHRAGFTLIEIMVALVVLSLLIVLVGNIFQQVSDSWNVGTESSEANTAARAALTFVAQELSQAVVGPVKYAPGLLSSGKDLELDLKQGELRFVALTGEPVQGNTRPALRGTTFKFENNSLKYCRDTTSFDPYRGVPTWDGSARTLITNVVDFQVYVYPNQASFASVPDASGTFTNELPAAVDLYLEILSEGDMRRWRATGSRDDFLDKHVQNYSTRVYFFNRKGYAK